MTSMKIIQVIRKFHLQREVTAFDVCPHVLLNVNLYFGTNCTACRLQTSDLELQLCTDVYNAAYKKGTEMSFGFTCHFYLLWTHYSIECLMPQV